MEIFAAELCSANPLRVSWTTKGGIEMRLILLATFLFAVSTAHGLTVTSVSVTATATSLTRGQTATLSCTANYSNGSGGACASPSYSENQFGSVVTLSGATVTGYAVGETAVTAAVGGVSGSLLINVVPPSQESLGAATAAQAVQGVGFNVTPGNAWEFSMAAAAGAKQVRFQCGWAAVENQTPAPQNVAASPRYTLPADCVSGLASAQRYGLHPDIVAAYGPPYHALLTLAVPNGAPAGATSINVQFVSGVGGTTLSSMKPWNDTIIGASSNTAYISNINSYAGALITGINLTSSTTATLTLASAISTALPANTSTLYTINEGLYAAPANFSPSNPSILAYESYVEFLAQSIAAAGLTGEVELWNEPPWGNDPWDNIMDYYDNSPSAISPGPQSQGLPDWGFVAALQSVAPINGVTYIWAGTEKSGTNSVLDPGMATNTGVAFTEPANSVTSESYHPYGNNPEAALWSASCLAALPGTGNLYVCNLFGVSGGNFNLAAKESLMQQASNPAWGVSHNITETGFGLAEGDSLHQARFTMRQLLGYQAAGVSPIDFYRLYDTSSEQLGFVNTSTLAPLPAYTAVEGFTADLAPIANAPITSYSAANLSSVVTYNGTFPLDTVHLVGSRSGDTANSEMLTLWQRSYVPSSGQWGTMSQPPAAPVTIALPTGTAVTKVVNLDTRAAVSYTTAGQNITFQVSDDPIEVLIEPQAVAAPTVVSISIAPATSTVTVGSTVTYTCTASLSNGTTAACSSPSYSSSNSGVASLAGTVATARAAGSVQIAASLGGSSAPAPAAAVLNVQAAATSTLSGLVRTYTGSPEGAVVTTLPAGLSYSITYAGSSTVPQAAGSYLVVAQITAPYYVAPAATGTLVIHQAVPTITWEPSTQTVSRGSTVGAGALDATSSIGGRFSYTASAASTGASVAITSRTVLAPGSYTLTARFTPTNSTDFSSTSKAIAFTVLARTKRN
jgi:plastocyanin